MTNLQFIFRFVKIYNLLEKECIKEQLEQIISGEINILEDYHLFNFINRIGTWSCTREGRLFWEIKQYQLFKLFYDLSEDKENARNRIFKESYFITGGYFERIRNEPIWHEVEQFKKEILL